MDCAFCGNEIPRGRGKTVVAKNGKTSTFCSMKCEKNLLKLKRKPRRIEWTKEGRKARGKD